MTLTRSYPATYTHVQSTAASTWVIQHDLLMYPIIDVYIQYGGSLQKAMPESVTHTTDSVCTVTFSSPQSGTAILT